MPSTTRRAFASGVAAALTVPLAGCGGSAPTVDPTWPQFGADAANTSTVPDTRGPTGRPDPAWVHLAGTYYRNSTQVLVAGDVYANTGHDGLYTLDPADGSVRWHDPTGYKPLTGAVAGGVVVPGGYGFRRVARDGGVSLLGHRVGYRDWGTAFGAYPESPPTVAGDVLVAGVGTAGRSRGGGRVVALDLADGTTRWSTAVGSTVWGAPAVADGVVYAAQRSDRDPAVSAALHAFDLADGDRRWRVTLGDDPRFDPIDAPVVGDGLVYLSTGTGPLVARDAASGDPVWTFDPPGGVQGSPALANGVLYVGDLDGTFHALDARTGDTRWTATVGAWYGGPTVAGDGVYAATFDGTLVAWRPDGTERWRVSVDPPVRTSPVVADGRVYLGTSDGLLYALA